MGNVAGEEDILGEEGDESTSSSVLDANDLDETTEAETGSVAHSDSMGDSPRKWIPLKKLKTSLSIRLEYWLMLSIFYDPAKL